MIQDLLHIIQREPAENRQAAIQPDSLTPHERSRGSGGQDQGRETGDGDNGDAGEEGPAQVEVFFLLGGCADEGDGAHHGGCVEAGAGEEGGLEEEEGGEDGGLGDVEAGPEGVFLDVAVARFVSLIGFYTWGGRMGVSGGLRVDGGNAYLSG